MRASRRFIALITVVLLAGCATGERVAAPTEAAWGDGPVGWIMTGEEAAEWQRVAGTGRESAFIEHFWAVRDPDPDAPGNAVRDLFERRVREADEAYGTRKVRGSLTDRGAVHLLLGRPAREQVLSHPAGRWVGHDSHVSGLGQIRKRPDLLIWEFESGQTPDLDRHLKIPFWQCREKPVDWCQGVAFVDHWSSPWYQDFWSPEMVQEVSQVLVRAVRSFQPPVGDS